MGNVTVSDPPRIRIPDRLLPGDGRFGCGPSKVRPEALADLAATGTSFLGTSHRQRGVRSVVADIRSGIRELFELPPGYEVVLGDGGSTVFWDAAAFGLVQRKSQHLSFGEFGAKFTDAVASAPFLDPPDVIETPAGTHGALVGRGGIDVYAHPHNETSTGVAMTPRRPDGADEGALLCIDATSAAGGLRFDARQVDVYYFAPQKCFASDGGLWVALMSPAALERVVQVASSGRWIPTFLDLETAVDNSRQDQTYNTPALASLFLLRHSIAWMLEGGGLEFTASRCDRSAEILYGWAEASPYAMPFVAKPSARSHVTGTIDFVAEVDAAAVATTLRANGIVDTEPYRKLGRNQLRVAMFPAIDPDDVATLTRAIDYVVDALDG